MLTLQKAFSQLRWVIRSAAEHSATSSQLFSYVTKTDSQSMVPNPTQTLNSACSRWFSTSCTAWQNENQAKKKTYEPASPYRNPGPRRYGYSPGYFTGGLLPRIDNDRRIRSLPTYKPRDSWNKKRALFGQNDYIDILGDGSVTPVDLISGPPWLIGFRGNELQRLARQLKFDGEKLANLYPAKYHNIKKRIFFLYKKYNQKRAKRVGKKRQ